MIFLDSTKLKISKSSLHLKRFIVPLLTTLNLRKQKVRQNPISRILLTPISTATNLLHVYYVNIASYETLEKIDISLRQNPINEMDLSS